ncbi:DNA polymerase IV [Nymphon striatum]|nr:DNA polymerase IV [Nymphon striatum]
MPQAVSTDNKNNDARKIIHVDMDCFFAAVEVRDNPRLKGHPVAVGGKPNTRGVVAACNYEAREFGVRSAMPMSQAVQRCPSLITTPVHMDLYKEVSAEIHSIFKEYTDLIEPLSLDEAYLDVSDSTHCNGSATLMAQEIRQKIFSSQKLTASAGIAPNKFLAKVASDWNKPNGQKVVAPDDVQAFVRDLSVTAISGVGKVTAKRMEALNLKTCYDLFSFGLENLQQQFGSFGYQLFLYSQGIDHRPVKTHWIRKSLSVEDTFSEDLPSIEACLLEIPDIYEELLVRLERARKNQKLIPRTLFVKIRFSDFETTTLQISGDKPDKKTYMRLCVDAWNRGKRPVRLIGIGLQFNPPDMPEQLVLFR